MTGIAAASFFSNTCRFGGCGLHFPTLAELIEHIEDNHIADNQGCLQTHPFLRFTFEAPSIPPDWRIRSFQFTVPELPVSQMGSSISHSSNGAFGNILFSS